MNSYNTSRLSDDTAISSRPMLSNLSFQMTLYYGMLYSVVFAVLTGAAAVEKVSLFIFSALSCLLFVFCILV